jgi:hypothetical protein
MLQRICRTGLEPNRYCGKKYPDYTPELNGTAGRNICIVMNMMRSMLKVPECPNNLWAEIL